MGGNGSGGHNRSNQGYVEQFARIDARELAGLGAFEDFWSGSVTQHRHGHTITIAIIRGWSDSIDVTCARHSSTGQYEELVYEVELDRVALHYGGDQPYFLCPSCRTRVRILLLGGGQVACRHCRRVVHAVTCERLDDRALRKAFKLRALMGGAENLLAAPPERPQQMSWRRYWLARRRLADAERAFWGAAAAELGLPEPKSG